MNGSRQLVNGVLRLRAIRKRAGKQLTDFLVKEVFQVFFAPVLTDCPPRGRLRTVACLAGVWLGITTPGFAQYSLVDLGDLGGGFARARAINEAGQVAGEALLPVAGIVDRAVLWQARTISDVGTLGGQQSAAFGINSGGTVCGWAQTASGNALPTLWNGNAVTALPTLGGNSGTAWGINDAGTAVGYSYLSAGGYHAALWSGGGVRDLGTLGGTYSLAYDINNRGVAVGTASDSSGRDRAVLWGEGGPSDLGRLSGGQWTAARGANDFGQVILWGTPLGAAENRAAFWNGDPSSPVIDLGTFGGGESWAYGLNDHGFVVGWAEEPDATFHAFVWNGAEKTDLGTLGGYYSSAYGINDQGIIVGYAMDASGFTHAVEWVPVPEPAALLLGLLGGGLVGVWTTCRRPPSVARR
jgi:probable HAF family extracellular repeat protein